MLRIRYEINHKPSPAITITSGCSAKRNIYFSTFSNVSLIDYGFPHEIVSRFEYFGHICKCYTSTVEVHDEARKSVGATLNV